MGCGASAGAKRYKVSTDLNQSINSECSRSSPRCSPKGGTPKSTRREYQRLDLFKRSSLPNDADKKLIQDALKATCFCATCSTEDLDELSANVDLYRFKEGDVVCQLNGPGTHFFVVSSGAFSEEKGIHMQKKKKREFERGSAFGELALMQDCKQKATVECLKDGSVWAVDGRTFRRVLSALSLRHADENRQKLAQVTLFKGLSEDQRDLLVGCMLVHSYPKGAYVVREGDTSDCVFIVKEGELKLSAKGKEIRRLLHGQYFGENALLHEEAQPFTVVCLSPTTCLSISRAKLQEVLRVDTLERLLFNNFITTALGEVFKQLTHHQVEALAQAMEQRAWDAGTILQSFREQEPRDLESVRFFVLLEGAVEVGEPNAPTDAGGSSASTTSRLDRGHCFGQDYVLQPTLKFGHSVKCVEAAKLALLTSEAIIRVLGTDNFKQVADNNEKMAALKSIYFFNVLSSAQLNRLADSFRILPPMKVEEIVVSQGEAGETFYFIAAGEVQVTIDDRPIRKMRRGEYFGERALLFSELRTASVTVSEANTILWAVDKQAFLPIVGDMMRSHLGYRCQLQDSSVCFSDLIVGPVLGKGNFGVVKEVTHSKTSTRYALKCMLKSRILQLDQITNVQREREILAVADHPFVIKLVRTFKDDNYIYFLTEILTGGELYQLIRKIGILDRPQAQFYFGSLALSIEYLHHRSVGYRDLKPENVLLTNRGYIKLIDFGCARNMMGQRSFSLVGTPHYMAPEVILGKGYKLTPDIWSLGVCLFEFMCGPLPFGHDSDDKLEIFKSVLVGQLSFPDKFQDGEGQDLIRQLLCLNPIARIGCSLRGFDDIKEHRFYSEFEWDKLLAMDIPPPHLPPEEIFSSCDRDYDSMRSINTWSEEMTMSDELALVSNTWDAQF